MWCLEAAPDGDSTQAVGGGALPAVTPSMPRHLRSAAYGLKCQSLPGTDPVPHTEFESSSDHRESNCGDDLRRTGRSVSEGWWMTVDTAVCTGCGCECPCYAAGGRARRGRGFAYQ